MRYHHSRARSSPRRIQLRGWRALVAFTAVLAIVLFGFLLPAARLLTWSLTSWRSQWDQSFIGLVGNSFLLAGLAAGCCLLIALLLGYGRRLHPGPVETVAVRLSSAGYAVPGTVIAVGVMIPFAWFDNQLDAWLQAQFHLSSGLVLSGTLAALVFAHVVRYLSVALQSVESGLARIGPAIDDAARSLGQPPLATLGKVHVPMLRGSLVTALVLGFVDGRKELPATLILRPFNFNTLSVRTYELASDERLADAATPALAIVSIGLIPVILLTRALRDNAETHDQGA